MRGRWPDKIRGIRIDHEGKQFKIGHLRDGIIFLEVGAGWHISILIKERGGALRIQPHITIEKPHRQYRYGREFVISPKMQKRIRESLRKLVKEGRSVLRNVSLEELRECKVEWFMELEKVKEIEFTVKRREVYLGEIISEPPIRPQLIKGPASLAEIESIENGFGVIDCGSGSSVDYLIIKLRGRLAVFDMQRFMAIMEKIYEIARELEDEHKKRNQARH